MKLDHAELLLFEAACADPGNAHAQELLNVFGVDSAQAVISSLAGVPIGLLPDLVNQVWHAVEEAKKRRGFQARFTVRPAAPPS